MTSKSSDNVWKNMGEQKYTTSPSEYILFLINGLLVAIVPLYLYTTIFNMALTEYFPFYLAGTLGATGLLTMAYSQIYTAVFTAYSRTRDLPDTFEIDSDEDKKDLSKKETLKAQRREKEQQLRKEQRESIKSITQTEAMSFSIFYNNLLFLTCVVLFGFYLHKNFSGLYNYGLSIGLAAGLVTLSSTNKL